MKVINWKRDYRILGLITLSLSLLLLLRRILFGNWGSFLDVATTLLIPIIGIYVFTEFVDSDGPRFSIQEAFFLLLSLYAAIVMIFVMIFNDFIQPINVLNLLVDFAIIGLGWLAIGYYAY